MPDTNDLPTTPPEADVWLTSLRQATAGAMINASGLPQASRSLLSSQFCTGGPACPPYTPDQVSAAIEAERSYLAALQADQVIQVGATPPRGGQITGLRTSLDQLEIALDALMRGVRPKDTAPLTGIREFYHLLSGDYEMSGLFQADRVQFATVNSSTMSNMVANVLNKILMQEFIAYPQWWTPIVNVENFTSLQDIRWIVLGGIGELPTVAEGAAYTELTWDDKYESSSFVKKGGYLGITIESIDKDDTGRLRMAPRALAQAAWLTLSKAISSIFTSNSGVGPTLSDTGALFNSTAVTSTGGHANLGTSALSMSTWATARLAMRKQAELNSGERLGALTAPRYLLVPPDLEVTALQILGTAMDYTYALSNGVTAPVDPYAETVDQRSAYQLAKERVIVVDLGPIPTTGPPLPIQSCTPPSV